MARDRYAYACRSCMVVVVVGTNRRTVPRARHAPSPGGTARLSRRGHAPLCAPELDDDESVRPFACSSPGKSGVCGVRTGGWGWAGGRIELSSSPPHGRARAVRLSPAGGARPAGGPDARRARARARGARTYASYTGYGRANGQGQGQTMRDARGDDPTTIAYILLYIERERRRPPAAT